MVHGGGWDDVVAAKKEKGFFNHSPNAVTKTGPLYCFGKQKREFLLKNFKNLLMALLAQVLDKMR